MEGTTKETVIIVHGTYARRSRWYRAAQPFTAKLNAALQERGSPARCWAHCGQGYHLFRWTGQNNWRARTRAASGLGKYVERLQNEGWQCHIIAHSHGGNVVVEALPKLLAGSGTNTPVDKIVTLGTPFMDTSSPILGEVKFRRLAQKIMSWFILIIAAFLILLFLTYWLRNSFLGPIMRQLVDVVKQMLLVLMWVVFLWGLFQRKKASEFVASHEVAHIDPKFLALGSDKDEAWQFLYHLRNSPDPFTRTSMCEYLVALAREHLLQRMALSVIRGEKSLSDLGFVAKLAAGCLQVLIHLSVVVALTSFIGFAMFTAFGNLDVYFLSLGVPSITYFLVELCTWFFGQDFRSACFSPYRMYARLGGAVWRVLCGVGTYVVRRKVWSVLLQLAMGLEGYPYRIPTIERRPSYVPQTFVRCENIPEVAERHALDERRAWIGRGLDDATQTFSAVAPADIDSLLRTIAADPSLVHAAYYNDERCIARIADWIAGRG